MGEGIRFGAPQTLADGESVTVDAREARYLTFVTQPGYGVAVLTLIDNNLDGLTVTIGAKVYTFQDTLTDVDGNVQVGVDEDESLDNLAAHVNGGAGADTAYAASGTADPRATAVANQDSTLTATARTRGTAYADATATDTNTTGAWDEDTFVVPADELPAVSWSRVDSIDADAHVDPVTLDGSETLATKVDVDWPYIHVSVADGDVRYALTTH